MQKESYLAELEPDDAIEEVYLGNLNLDALARGNVECGSPTMSERAKKIGIKGHFGHARIDDDAIKHHFARFLQLLEILEQKVAFTVAHDFISPADCRI